MSQSQNEDAIRRDRDKEKAKHRTWIYEPRGVVRIMTKKQYNGTGAEVGLWIWEWVG